jgi:phospholipid/cholesterol/gamma-HCH transport system substrate-binding protein
MATARRRALDLEHWGLLGGAAGLLALLVLGMGTPRNWWTRNLQLSFRTYSAAGLQEGMAVKISGYPVGRVQRIRLLNDAQVHVTLEIAASREPMVGRRSRATVAQDGLLNRPYITISPDLTDLGNRDPLSSGDSLIFETSPDIATLIKEVAASRVPLQQMLTRAAGLVERRVPRSLDQLDRTLGSGERLANLLEREVSQGSGALQGRVTRATDNLETTLTTLQSTLVEIQSLARSSNSLLQGIRRSWLIQLLEPADTPASSPTITPTQPSPGAAAKPATRCPGGAPCRD